MLRFSEWYIQNHPNHLLHEYWNVFKYVYLLIKVLYLSKLYSYLIYVTVSIYIWRLLYRVYWHQEEVVTFAAIRHFTVPVISSVSRQVHHKLINIYEILFEVYLYCYFNVGTLTKVVNYHLLDYCIHCVLKVVHHDVLVIVFTASLK